MSGHSVRAALAGGGAGFLAGISWLPAETLDALAFGTDTVGAADSLATVAQALELDFAFVPAHESWAPEAVHDLHERGIATVWTVAGVLGRAAERLGWIETLRLTAAEPGALAVLLGEALHDAMDEARAGRSARADAMLVADDLAGASGPLVSPDFALDALLPCYRAVTREAAENDVPAIFHSDGDVRALLPALARAGFSAVHLAGLASGPFSASYAAARTAGLVVLGGVEVTALMSGARRLGAYAGSLALSGGMLVCDDGGITSAEEVAAYATALEAARGTYAAGSPGPVDRL
ncbi:MAG TPA: uroporphyrinogen decarboxylase family protein [Coriobacteriia bacterium]